MSSATASPLPWAERAADRSPTVQRSRARQMEQAQVVVDAAKRLIAERGDSFTTQELVKEAGVALQTFYRLFGGKDQLLLAVFEDLIGENSVRYEEEARDLPDPVARLHSYITAAVGSMGEPSVHVSAQFVTAQHWRLSQLFPEEMAHATQHFTDLVERQVMLANADGLLASKDPQRDSWFVTKLVMAVFHNYAFAGPPPDAATVDELWQFCLGALGGTT